MMLYGMSHCQSLSLSVIDEWFFAGEVCHRYVMFDIVVVLVRSCAQTDQTDSVHFLHI
jgi:hypothetical protein